MAEQHKMMDKNETQISMGKQININLPASDQNTKRI